MRWRVVPGQVVTRSGATFGPGEEFEATAEDAKGLDGLVERVDAPKAKEGD